MPALGRFCWVMQCTRGGPSMRKRRPVRAHAARMIAGVVAILTAVVLAATAAPAFAMVNGTPDNAHPEGGALYFSATPTSARHFACSGALIDTQVFLTAAHCFAGYYR